MVEGLARDFKGIWIPREIWLNEAISIQAKVLWAEIHSLYDRGKGGCFASNEYLCDFLGIKLSRLKEVMKELRDHNLLVEVSFNGRTRIIKAINPPEEGGQQPATIPASSQPVAGKPDVCQPENRPSSSRKTGRPSIYRDISIEKRIENTYVASPSAHDVCAFFIDQIKSKKPNFTKGATDAWLKDFERLLKIRSPEQIKELIVYVVKSEFWFKNILCPDKLHKQLDRLEIEMSTPPASSPEENPNISINKKLWEVALTNHTEYTSDIKYWNGALTNKKTGMDVSFKEEPEEFKNRLAKMMGFRRNDG